MKAEDLYYTFQKRPFPPMRIHLKDGRKYDIPSREMVIVGVDFLEIGIQADDEPEGIWETAVRVPVDDVTAVETIPGQPLARS